jgi:O-acetyl-ADP-ribose deacetylase (regulator of RNase III)
MSLKYINGDLVKMAFNGEFGIIVHGCNCFCNMGAGIAKQIKQTFPEAYVADCQTIPRDRNKLGKLSIAYSLGITVINAYTQYGYGRNKAHVDYAAIRSCMKEVKKLVSGLKIGMPLIGAGLGGGDWAIIEKIIEEELQGEDVTIVKYTP